VRILTIVSILLALAATQSSDREPATVILKTPRREVRIDHLCTDFSISLSLTASVVWCPFAPRYLKTRVPRCLRSSITP